MADIELSRKLRHEIEQVEKLLVEAQAALDKVSVEVEHLKGRLETLKKLAAIVEAEEDED